jgi:hypothetical protein
VIPRSRTLRRFVVGCSFLIANVRQVTDLAVRTVSTNVHLEFFIPPCARLQKTLMVPVVIGDTWIGEWLPCFRRVVCGSP